MFELLMNENKTKQFNPIDYMQWHIQINILSAVEVLNNKPNQPHLILSNS